MSCFGKLFFRRNIGASACWSRQGPDLKDFRRSRLSYWRPYLVLRRSWEYHMHPSTICSPTQRLTTSFSMGVVSTFLPGTHQVIIV